MDVDELHLGNDAVRDFLGGDRLSVPDRYNAASTMELLPFGLPQLVVHGELDEDVPVENARRYIEAGRNVGDQVESLVLPGIGHFEIVDPGSAVWPVVEAAIRSMLQH